MLKRIFALLVCCMLLTSLLPVSALAMTHSPDVKSLTAVQTTAVTSKDQAATFTVTIELIEGTWNCDYVKLYLDGKQKGNQLTLPSPSDNGGTITTTISCSWNDLEDGMGELKAATYHVTDNQPFGSEKITLFVEVSEPVRHTVTFAGGEGATGTMENLTGEAGSAVTLTANGFTREGYTFDGWKDANGTEYADGATVTLTGDLALTAQWTENAAVTTYTVSFAGGEGATGTMENLTGEAGTAVTLTANGYTKEGYIFAGWKDANGNEYADGATVTLTGDLALTALWTEATEEHTHTLEKVGETPATCTTPGIREHWKCTDTACGKLFADDKGENEITDTAIPAAHTLGKVNAKAATCTEAGIREHWMCSAEGCGKLFADDKGKNEITDIAIPAGHTLTDVALVEATYTTPGTRAHKTCSGCTKLFTPEDQETTAEELVIPQLIVVTGTTADVSMGALEKAADAEGNVTLDLNSAEFVGEMAVGTIHFVKLPTGGLSEGKSLTVHIADGSILFDDKALAEIVEQAECARVTLFLDEIETTSLGLFQRNALKKYDVVKVVTLGLTDCDGVQINTADKGGFGAGSVKLTLPDITKTKNNIYYKYVAENGTLKGIAGTYSATKKTGTMHLLNTGDHAVVRLKADTSNPATGDTSNIKLWIGLMAGSAVALVIVVILMTRKPRKKK